MNPTMCTQCGKNVAVIFITKIENGVQKQEGLCLRCARKMHIKPVDDVIEKMGLTDDLVKLGRKTSGGKFRQDLTKN